MESTLQQAILKVVDRLKAEPEFYGTFSLVFQAGKVHIVRVEETHKITPP